MDLDVRLRRGRLPACYERTDIGMVFGRQGSGGYRESRSQRPMKVQSRVGGACQSRRSPRAFRIAPKGLAVFIGCDTVSQPLAGHERSSMTLCLVFHRIGRIAEHQSVPRCIRRAGTSLL